MQLQRQAERLAAAGFGALVFDYRHFGDSGGEPRQVVSIPDQYEDWDAAISFAGRLDWVDRSRIALWGTSF
jgi:predicted alpha/beta hydrolase